MNRKIIDTVFGTFDYKYPSNDPMLHDIYNSIRTLSFTDEGFDTDKSNLRNDLINIKNDFIKAKEDIISK
ncbi:MAG: hypothetical protein QM528_06260 [Phycisphaerales bacterium]|nr:hypothetical protein [Phycisphaerales bacterium]